MKFFAKKSLGQNFLKSEKALQDIVNAGDIKQEDCILEIGPGQGALTERFLETGAQVIAIEKDRRLIGELGNKFKEYTKKGALEIIEADILEMNFSKILPAKYKVIANIPYYITGEILRNFLSNPKQPELMVLLVQKEVADRIIAKNKKESLLSISVKVYGQPAKISTVKAGSFVPAPKVDSAILKIDKISKDFFKDFSEQKFFQILKAGFGQKRKKLSGNLSKVESSEKIEKAFKICQLDQNVRAENLSIQKWKCLVEKI